jgi:ATP-binding cassette subfamily B protein
MNKNFFLKYISMLKDYKCLTFLIISCLVEIMRGFIMTQGIAWGVKWIADGCVKGDFDLFFKGISFFTFAIVFSVVVVYISELLYRYKTVSMVSTFRNQIINKALYGEFSKVRGKQQDEMFFVYNSNIANVIDFYGSIKSFVGSFGKIIGGYLAGFLLSWQLTLLLVAFGAIKILVDKKVTAPLVPIMNKLQEDSEKVFSFLSQNIEGIVFFRLTANKDKIRNKFNDYLEENKNLIKKSQKVSINIDAINSAVQLFALLSLLVCGAFLTMFKTIEIGVFASFLSMYDFFVNPYTFVSNYIQQFNYHKVGIQKIFDIIYLEDDEEKQKFDNEIIKKKFLLKIKDLSFKYENGKSIFNKFYFEFKSGEVTYIVGRSGIGKSTLFKILAGLLKQDKGEIIIQGADNKTCKVSPSIISYVSQVPFLFNGTVAENIALTDEKDIDYEKLEQAIKKAGAQDFVQSLPQTYNHMIMNKGANFSGGQRCRLALARIFYNPTPIILFDEVYASVDNITISDIEKSILELCSNNTCVLFISHRKEWISSSANTLYLEDYASI